MMTDILRRWAVGIMAARPPDRLIGGPVDTYMRRWYVIPRNPVFNIYLHEFLRSDDDRALHTHPWVNVSLIISGRYREHMKEGFRDVSAGQWRVRLSGNIAHRIELTHGRCVTLFITGPRYQEWGFLCPQGFVHWTKFTKAGTGAPDESGPGCGE